MKKIIILFLGVILMAGIILGEGAAETEENLIAFSVRLNKESEIYVYSLNQNEYRKLGKGYTPSWSPKKNKIVFYRHKWENDFSPDVFRMNKFGEEEVKLTNNTFSLTPSWAENRNFITYISYLNLKGKEVGPEVFLMKPNGKKKKRITYNDVYDSNPDVSPNGDEIVYESNKRIVRKKADGSESIYLTNSERDCLQPKWSPNGKEILFLSKQNKEKNIYVVNKEGKEKRQITEEKNVKFVTWSSTGEKIAFAATGNDGFDKLFIINKKGNNLKKVDLPFDKKYKFTGLDW